MITPLLAFQNKEYYDRVGWFFRMQEFTYLGMGFQLLRIDATMTFWSSVYYVGHLILPVLYLIGLLIVKPYFKPPKTEDKTD